MDCSREISRANDHLDPLADKWTAFGWSVREVNGHDHGALLRRLRSTALQWGKPNCIIAHTHKGQGVSSCAIVPHGTTRADHAELARASGSGWEWGARMSPLFDCRDAFAQALEDVALHDSRVCAVVNDWSDQQDRRLCETISRAA